MRRFLALGFILTLASCGVPAPDPLEEDLPDMGDFRLAYNIVVADNMQQVPPSRGATPEEWEAVLQAEIDRRFGGYEGDRLYHIAIAVDGYSLAPPGIPLVVSPKSILVISANIWDDEAEAKLHDEPNQITVFEGVSGATILGSGLVRTREEQMEILARNAVRRIQLWMLENPDWFSIDPDLAATEAAELAEIAQAEEPEVDGEALASQVGACVETDETVCPEPEIPADPEAEPIN